jgi:hypothetical protein
MWLDISDPLDPTLMWNEGPRKDKGRVKDKDSLRLVEILSIKAGRSTPALQRTGTSANAARYMSFDGEEGTRCLDVEYVSPAAQDFFFKKFHELFQAYAVTQKEKLKGDSVTVRVAGIVDGGAPAVAAKSPTPAPSAAAAAAAAAARGTGGAGGVGGMGSGVGSVGAGAARFPQQGALGAGTPHATQHPAHRGQLYGPGSVGGMHTPYGPYGPAAMASPAAMAAARAMYQHQGPQM